jgi:hypothetical protein
MSKRESIAQNLVTTLQAASSPVSIKLVTREPFDFEKLSNAQYPAVLIQTASENRSDGTIGDDQVTRLATATYQILGYTKGTGIDTARNNLIETIEESLDVDRTRGGNALDTQVVNIETDQGAIAPVGGVIITVEVSYTFNRGST